MRAPSEVRAAERIPFARAEIADEAREAVTRVLASGWVTTGPEVALFEEEFAAWLGADQAIAVSSCTEAIELSLRGLGLAPGSTVLTSTMTFSGVVQAIVHAGLTPILCDIDPASMMPGESEIRAAVSAAGGVDAMVLLHFAGFPAPVEDMASAAGLPLSRVVEDAAHALGTCVGDRPVGTISAATCFSFYATKNLPIGEGGMITSSDPDLIDYVSRGRLHGMSRDAWQRYLPGNGWRYSVEVDGLKANMTDLQAAIGRVQLRHLDAWQARRAAVARRYDEGLTGIPGVRAASLPRQGRHGWHLYVIQVSQAFGVPRDRLITALAARGIDCSVHFIPVHHHGYFQRLLPDGIRERFPGADEAFRSIVSLPMYPSLSDEQVDRVCREIAAVGASC